MSYQYAEGETKDYDYNRAYNEHGNTHYLDPTETFEGVMAKDKAILESQGVTHKEIGQSLRQLLKAFNKFRMYRVLEWQSPIEGIRIWPTVYELGQEYSPYLTGVYSNIDWKIYIDGLDNGNKAYHPKDGPTFVSDMLPDMIEQLGFFEGSVFYGIQPEWAIKVHQLVQKHQPQSWIPKYSPRAWSGFRCYEFVKDSIPGQYSPSPVVKAHWTDRGLSFPPDQIIQASIHRETLLDGLFAYVAPGHLQLRSDPWSDDPDKPRILRDGTVDTRHTEYWGLIIASKDVRLLPDTTLMGIPFPHTSSRFGKGEVTAINVFPHYDKLIG